MKNCVEVFGGVPAGSATEVGMDEVQNADSLRERE